MKLVELGDKGVVVKRRGVGELTIVYAEILTAERLRSRRGLDLHTAVYLRRLNRVKAMERVRDLSWRSVFPPEAVEAHTGFEPVPPP